MDHHQSYECAPWMALLSTNVIGDIDCLRDTPILACILHRDNDGADNVLLSEESEQALTSESNASPVKKHRR